MFSDRGREMLAPLSGNGRTRAIRLVQRDELNKMFAREGGTEPFAGLSPPAGDHWLVHQVVAEDGGTFGAAPGNRFPEACLCVPSVFL
jgi:hypothetical protein